MARSLADSWIARHPAEEMHWDWIYAVLAYALLDLYEATGDEKYLNYVERWLKTYTGVFPMLWSDTVAPTASAARIAKWTCDPVYLEMIDRTTAYLVTAPRTEEGGIGHLGYLQEELPQLWVDSLFMFGSFLMARGELSGTEKDWKMYAEQIEIFSLELQDQSGFFRHALVHEKPFPASPVFWGRGNGWVANIVSRFLTMLPKTHPQYAAVAGIERRLLEAALRTQDGSGLWWTVLNAPGETYLETSAAALLGDALRRGVELGLVNKTEGTAAYEMALAAVKAKVVLIDGLPTIAGTSGSTQPGGLEYYGQVNQRDDIAYGVGSAIMLMVAP